MDLEGPGSGGWSPRPTPPEPKPPAANPFQAIGDAFSSVARQVQSVFERVPIVRPNPMFGGPAATPTPTPAPTPTATPTTTPTPPVTSAPAPAAGPVYWGGLTEAQLAAFQHYQGAGRNDCADFSVAAVLNMFTGGAVQGRDVATEADQRGLLQGYRLWANGPTTPGQAANIVNTIADRAGLPVSATAVKPETTADLVTYLQQPDTAVIVTIGWDDAHVPDIARTSDTANSASGGAPLQLNAHAMVLAAYDPGHVDRNGNPAPWGFVNSWADGGTQIYWIPDADFQRAWSHEIPLVGSHNAVVVTRSTVAVADATGTPTPTITPAPVATPPAPTSTPEATGTPSPPGTTPGR